MTDIDDSIADAFNEIAENQDTEEVVVVRADAGSETMTLSATDTVDVLSCPVPSSTTLVSGSLLVC